MGLRYFRSMALPLLLSVASAVQAAERYVDGAVSVSGDGTSWQTAFKTIQEGINAAADGDTVLVARGTYTENIEFKGKNIILSSTDPLDLTVVGNTVIDGNHAGSVVAFSGTEEPSCVLTGFTIQHGEAEKGGGICGVRVTAHTGATLKYNAIVNNSADYGGGVYGCDGVILNNAIFSNSANRLGGGLSHCHGIIRDNSIAGNTCASEGGGLAYCGGNIEGNTIMSNAADSNGGGLHQCNGAIKGNKIKGNTAWVGGGLYWCDGLIQNNTIEDNSVPANGGGLYNCDGIIRNNTISGNSAQSAGGVGSCNGTVENNTVTENSVEWRGGGVAYCDGTVRNNTITGNSTTGNSGTGAGVYGCDATIQSNLIVANSSSSWGGGLASCSGVIQNCTIAHNSAGRHGGGLTDCDASILNCILWGNAAPTEAQLYNSSEPSHSCIQDWGGSGEGNINSNPGFVNEDGPDDDPGTFDDNDYHLAGNSPCIDAGVNSMLTPPGFDLDGNLRIARWKYPIVAIVDMGAYEYSSKPFAMTEFGFTGIPLPFGGRLLVWNSQPNDTYTVWSSYSLAGTWNEVGTVASEGTTTSYTATGLLLWNWRALFYRVEME